MSIFKRLFSGKKNTVDKDYSKLIFDLYYKSAYNAAYFYCGDSMMSEEAAQESIFKAIKKIDQLRDADKIEAWIKRIAINNVNSMINKNKKVISLDSVAPMIDSVESSPEFVVQTKDSMEAVNRAVNLLDPEMKQIIFLFYYQEMKVKDISIFLDKPEGTIKTLLHRARALIRNKLIKEGYIVQESEGGLKVGR